MAETAKKFRRRAEARPDEVLDAALAVFVEKGFAAAKVDEIARQAGVSKGLVYLYFPSKEALLEGIVSRALAPVAATAVERLSAQDGDPRLVITMLLTMLGQLVSDPSVLAVPRLVLQEVARFPQIAAMYRRQVLDKVVPALRGLVQRGVDNGQLRPVDPEMAVRSIVGPVLAHLALSELFDMRPADGIAMQRLIGTHLDILFHGLGTVQP